MQQTKKIFATSRSQAIQLPMRLSDGDETQSCKTADWQGLLEVVAQNMSDDLLIERRSAAATTVRRGLFKDWKE